MPVDDSSLLKLPVLDAHNRCPCFYTRQQAEERSRLRRPADHSTTALTYSYCHETTLLSLNYLSLSLPINLRASNSDCARGRSFSSERPSTLF